MKPHKIKRHHQRGISLIELAITVTIIGLLVAAIAGGFNLVHSSKLRSVIGEVDSLRTAISEFEGSYGYLPGDLPTAFDYWGGDCGADSTGTAGDCNGDGDGFVEFSGIASGVPQEDLLAFEHLALSDLISGSFTGQDASGGNRFEVGANTYALSSFTSAAFMFRTEADKSAALRSDAKTIYGTRGSTIRLGEIGGNGIPEGGFLTAKDARAIDLKMDDGKARSGTLYTIISPLASTGCIKDNREWHSTSDEVAYDLENDEETCHLVYWYKKF